MFWRDFLEAGAGGTCYARVAAFDALASEVGFATRKVLGRVEKDFDHAALVVSIGGNEWIADAGFPLPALVPAGGGEIETQVLGLSATESERGTRVRFSSGVPGGPRGLEIFREPVAEREFLDHWRRTFRPDSRFLGNVSLQRRDASRTVTFARGEVRVDDLHTRTRLPLSGDRAPKLAELFGIEAEVLRRAFSIAGDPEPEIADARIAAYLSVNAGAAEAFAPIESPEGYRRLMGDVADVTGEGWRLRLSPPGAPDAGFEEEVSPDAQRRELAVKRLYRDGRTGLLAFRVEEHDGETWLVREAVLSGPREDLLKNDSARGRMAGTLAVDLLAWSRRI